MIDKYLIFKEYVPGVTMQQLADKHGITKQRVSQILREFGYSKHDLIEVHRIKTQHIKRSEVESLLLKGVTIIDMQKILGVGKESLDTYLALNIGRSIPDARRRKLELEKEAIFQDYKIMGFNQLQKKYKHSASSIRSLLEKNNIEIRKVGPRPKQKKGPLRRAGLLNL